MQVVCQDCKTLHSYTCTVNHINYAAGHENLKRALFILLPLLNFSEWAISRESL